MATAPPEEHSCSVAEAGDGEKEDRERAEAEVRQLSDQKLQEKAQRTQKTLSDISVCRLPDNGRKLRVLLDACHQELARRQAHREAPCLHDVRARSPEGDGRKSIVQSRCTKSSGLATEHKVTKGDFLSAFSKDEKAGVDISSSEITSRSPDEHNISVENDGKLRGEKYSCNPSTQPRNSSHKKLYRNGSANMEKMSSDDASKDNGHNQMSPSPTSSLKRKGASPANYSMRLRSRKEVVVLLDGDTHHSESSEVTSNNWGHPNSVEISCDDIRCLQPESLLSSPIMNFYITYLQGPMPSIIRPRSEYHIFNTYFFSKLEAMTLKEDKTSYFVKLRRWWKGVDIFQKAYIFLPVHAEAHWSLVIICMPAKENRTGPIVLHLDSLKFHRSRLIFNVVNRFLKEEWYYLNGIISPAECPLQETVWKNLPRKIEKKTIEVPQQENDYDCGLFVLYYMQRFIEEAPARLQKKYLSRFGKGWFKPEEPSQLRHQIRDLLQPCGEDKSKNAATELCGEAESNHDATNLCAEDEPKNGAIEATTLQHLAEGVDGASCKSVCFF